METIHITYPHQFNKEDLPETVAAIGFFDGVHKGHQSLIQEAVQQANTHHKMSAVISFHPHPSVVLKKSVENVQYITTMEEKETLLAEMGVDTFYVITFNKELSLLPPKAFIDHFIIGLNICHLVAGFDYTFGHKGAGNMTNILEYSDNKCKVTEMEKVTLEDEKVSSTRIRKALADGDVGQAALLLGRHYETTGKVIHGDKRGKKLGFPTANLEVDEEKLLPKQGVYAVTIYVRDQIYEAMASLGLNPTFKVGVTKPTIEVNIFDFDQDIYGESVTIYWHKYTREEIKFNGVEEIIEQLKEDEVQIREYFAKEK